MERFSALLRSGVRGLLLATVILSMLVAGAGADLHLALSEPHGHADEAGCPGLLAHGHSADHAVGHVHGDAVDATGGAATDPDDCGHCHCPSPSSDVPGSVPAVPASEMVDVMRLPLDEVALQGISFQPDPPPVRG